MKNAVRLLAIYLIWGMNWVVMKSANAYFDPEFFVTLRFCLGAVILLALCVPGRKLIPGRSFIIWIIISGVLQMGAHNLFIQIAMKDIGSGIAAVVDYTMPLWVNLIAVVALGEKLTLRKISGIILSIAGLVILMNAGIEGDPRAFALTIAGSVTWAVSNVISKAKLKDCSPLTATAWQMVSASVFLILFSVSTGKTHAVLNAGAAGTLIYNALLASAIGFLLWNSVLDTMEAGKASVALMAVPVFGVIGGVIFLHEELGAGRIAGIAAVIAGILIVLTGKEKTDIKEQAT